MESIYQFAQTSPETAGISSVAIKTFVEKAETVAHSLHSFILLRHGQLVAQGWWQPYQPEDQHILFSLSKSFTSTAVGLAVAEGKLKIDDQVISFFPDSAPATISPNLAAMQVRDLLTMTTGHADDTLEALFRHPEASWVQTFLSLPIAYQPGTHFLYNTGATYMLSAIVQEVTGQTLLEYLQPRLFEPLGIENPKWEASPQGIITGGFGLSLTTPDIARFGQLYLQKGKWHGQEILQEEWVQAATSAQVPNGTRARSDWEQGYGYQFWRCRYNAYRGDGAFGQYCVVMPEQDAVLAITSGLQEDMQVVLDLVWKYLLPAMHPNALPADPKGQQELAQKLAKLELPAVQGKPTSQLATQISGKRFVFEDARIKAINLNFDAGGCVLNIEDESGHHEVECGQNEWRLGTTTLNSDKKTRRVGASGNWTSPDTYTIKVYFRTPALPDPPLMSAYLIPFDLSITCKFKADKVTLKYDPKLFFPANGPIIIEGRIA